MSPEELKTRGRRITEELFNQGDLSVADELVAADYTEYIAGDLYSVSSVDDLTKYVAEIRGAFPDLRSSVEDQIVEGDRLVQRITVAGTHDGRPFMGLPACGHRITVSLVSISRIGADGRFVEQWTWVDQLTLLRQLGAMPALAQGGAR